MGKSFGQITSYVLQDMFEWLASPARDVSEEIQLDLKVSPTRHRPTSVIEELSRRMDSRSRAARFYKLLAE